MSFVSITIVLHAILFILVLACVYIAGSGAGILMGLPIILKELLCRLKFCEKLGKLPLTSII